jgi:hypothetical protein
MTATKRSTIRFVVCLLPLLIIGLTAAHAGVAPFKDRAAWEAALGGPPTFMVDFNTWVTDTSLDPPLDVGPCILQHNGGLQGDGRSKVDADPFQFGSSVDGTAGVEIFVNGSQLTVDLWFPQPIWAFGADWQFAGNSGNPLRISGYDPNGILLFTFSLNEPTRTVFFGFTSDPPEQIAQIRLSNAVNDGLRIDNVGGAVDQGGGQTPADPLALLAQLKDDVIALGLHRGIENALLSKLQAATLLLVDMLPSNDHAAENILDAFINQVNAQSGKKIPPSDAADLMAAAQAIIDALNGGGTAKASAPATVEPPVTVERGDLRPGRTPSVGTLSERGRRGGQ